MHIISSSKAVRTHVGGFSDTFEIEEIVKTYRTDLKIQSSIIFSLKYIILLYFWYEIHTLAIDMNLNLYKNIKIFEINILIMTWAAEKPICQIEGKNDYYNIPKSCHFVFVFQQVVSHIFHNPFVIISRVTLLLIKIT